MIADSAPDAAPARLFSTELVALCLVLVAAFGTISAFYGFYHYLGAIGIPVAWRGFLVGVEPMAALGFRILLLPWLDTRNAMRAMLPALAALSVVSCAFTWAASPETILLLRIAQGAAFVLLTSAAVILLSEMIPAARSGQGFMVISIATVLPFAAVPPLCEALLPRMASEADIYAIASVFSVVALVIYVALRRRIAGALTGASGRPASRPTMSGVTAVLRTRSAALVLGAGFFAYFAHATVFFFAKSLTIDAGISRVGLFFTISMVTMLAVRAAGGSLFDRTDKRHLLAAGLVVMGASVQGLVMVTTEAPFLAIALAYGLGVGVAMPLLNAVLFTCSPAPYRGLSINMGLCTMDAAYCLAPYAGGAAVALGASFGTLFSAAALAVVLAVVAVLAIRPETRAPAIVPTTKGE